MKTMENAPSVIWRPFAIFGLTNPFFDIDSTVVINTWLVILFIVIISYIAGNLIYKPNTISGYIVRSYVRSFMDMVEQSLGKQVSSYSIFITALFTFIFLCNCISLIPGLREPTENLNTTLALGILCFIYTQYQAISTHGFWGYIKEYFMPIPLLFPLHVLGKLAGITSISFRLFGNIFGGAMICQIYKGALSGSFLYQTIGILTGINLIITFFFGIFEGFIQAFVFSILTLTYLAMAIQHERD